jgi:LysM repeat protein
MLVSTFEVLLKPQFPKDAPSFPGGMDISKLSRAVIEGYFLTIANTNSFDVIVSLIFTLEFPQDTTVGLPKSFRDFIDAVDITGKNIFPGNNSPAQLIPILTPERNKARLTFTIPKSATSLVILQPDFISQPQLLKDANFESRGYVELFVSSQSSSGSAKLLVTPQLRGTFYKNLSATNFSDVGLDQIAYDLPTATGTSLFDFKLSKNPIAGATYVVQPKDFLFSIAEKVYGDGNKFTVIYEANKNVIGSDPKVIEAGQVLFIPTL